MMVPKFQASRPIADEAIRNSREPLEHTVAFPLALFFLLEFEFVIDVQCPNESVLKPVFLQKNLPFQLGLLVADARLEIKRESYRSFVRAEQPINRFERNRFEVVTVE